MTHRSDAAAIKSFLREDVLGLLDDPNVSEIYCNPDLVLRSHGLAGRAIHGTLNDQDLMAFFALLASNAGVALDAENPIGDFLLPEGLGSGRLHARVPPAVEKPIFVWRKRPARLLTLPELVDRRSLSHHSAEHLVDSFLRRKSILIAGATNSGKTSFLNALLKEALTRSDNRDERWIVLEDVPEVRCDAPDVLISRTSPGVTLWDLVRATMRASPTRIVVGELRGKEAYPFLDLASSGHPGVLATIHAEEPLGALLRLNRLARLAGTDLADQHELIASVISVVVCLACTPKGRRVTHIADVVGWSARDGYDLSPLVLEPAADRQEH